MKVTVCVMPDDREEFAAEWGRLAAHVRRESSDAVLLPEMGFSQWFCAFPKARPGAWEEAVEEHEAWMRRLPELGAPVVLGTRPVVARKKKLNRAFVWTKAAGVKHVHDKYYLPNEPGYYEVRWYHRGDGRFVPFKAGGLKMGFMICSDLWAMPVARSYGKKGVDLLLVPRATGEHSLDKWMAGGKTAAVVAGAYCASSNRTGSAGEARFGGKGWMFGPDGEVLGLTTDEERFVTVEIDGGKARKAKGTYPRYSLEPD